MEREETVMAGNAGARRIGMVCDEVEAEGPSNVGLSSASSFESAEVVSSSSSESEPADHGARCSKRDGTEQRCSWAGRANVEAGIVFVVEMVMMAVALDDGGQVEQQWYKVELEW
jgi:hypothetical protein